LRIQIADWKVKKGGICSSRAQYYSGRGGRNRTMPTTPQPARPRAADAATRWRIAIY